jgi:hypothetical protein
MDEKVKKNLDHLFKVVLYKNIGKFESKKITNEQEHGKPVVKGKSGEEAKQIAKEYTYREFLNYLNQLYLNAALKKPKPPKTVKVKHKKFKKAPKDPKSYRRRLYIPISLYGSIENKIYKYGYATFDNSIAFLNDIENTIDRLKFEYESQMYEEMQEDEALYEPEEVTFDITVKWEDITPNPKCNVCWQLAANPPDIDTLLSSGGMWNISHENCDCKIIVIIDVYRGNEYLTTEILEHTNDI